MRRIEFCKILEDGLVQHSFPLTLPSPQKNWGRGKTFIYDIQKFEEITQHFTYQQSARKINYDQQPIYAQSITRSGHRIT